MVACCCTLKEQEDPVGLTFLPRPAHPHDEWLAPQMPASYAITLTPSFILWSLNSRGTFRARYHVCVFAGCVRLSGHRLFCGTPVQVSRYLLHHWGSVLLFTWCIFIFLTLGVGSRALYLLWKCSTIEPHPTPHPWFSSQALKDAPLHLWVPFLVWQRKG